MIAEALEDPKLKEEMAEEDMTIEQLIEDSDDIIDEYGNPLQCKALDGGSFELRSAGPDGKFDTADDKVEEY